MLTRSSLPILLSLLLVGISPADEPSSMARYVAVDNVCAWPQLFLLRDGTIAALLQNLATIKLPQVDRTVTPDLHVTEKFAKLRGK